MTATHSPMHDRRPAVVVIRARGLGDLLTAIPALRALADAFPRHPRLLAAPAVLAPLARASGTVDEVVPTEGLAEPLHRRLHGAGLAVNLHGRGPESHDLLLAAEPRRLVAFTHPAVPASSQGPRWRPDEHEVARWCRLLEESGIAAGVRRIAAVTGACALQLVQEEEETLRRLAALVKSLHEQNGVRFHLGRKPTAIDQNSVTLDDGSKLDAFLEAIDRTAILETVRTGASGIGRGERILRV